MPKDEFPPRTPPTMHRCSFCGKTQDQVRRLVAGPNVYICNECILLCQEIISDDLAAAAPTTSDPKDLPKPAEMKAVLDDYVVGQEEAKRALCVAVYNHYKRINAPSERQFGCGAAKVQHPDAGPHGLRQDLLGPDAGADS